MFGVLIGFLSPTSATSLLSLHGTFEFPTLGSVAEGESNPDVSDFGVTNWTAVLENRKTAIRKYKNFWRLRRYKIRLTKNTPPKTANWITKSPLLSQEKCRLRDAMLVVVKVNANPRSIKIRTEPMILRTK